MFLSSTFAGLGWDAAAHHHVLKKEKQKRQVNIMERRPKANQTGE